MFLNTEDVHEKQCLQHVKIAFSKTLFYVALFHTLERNEYCFFLTLVLSIAMETIGALTLFPLLYMRCYEARMRNFMLLKNISSAEFHGSLLVPLSALSLFCLVPLPSPLLRGFPSSPQLSPHFYFLLPHLFTHSFHFHLLTRISMLGIPSPDLSPWIQSQKSNCSI